MNITLTRADYYLCVIDDVAHYSLGYCDLGHAIEHAKELLAPLKTLKLSWSVCHIISDITGEIDATILNTDKVEMEDTKPTKEEVITECDNCHVCSECRYQRWCPADEEEGEPSSDLIGQLFKACFED